MAKSKSFKEYKYQVIDHEKKRIIYTDNDQCRTSPNLEVNPIEFRKIIGPSLRGYKIKAK